MASKRSVIRARRLWIIATAGIAMIALLLGTSSLRPHCTPVSGIEQISIPLGQVGRGVSSFFCHRDEGGKRLRFILARDEEGNVHSVLDACRQCSSYHKGYASSDGDLVCRLCGNRYQLSAMEKGRASCVPVELPNRQHNGIVEIQVSDLKRGRALF